MSSSYCFFFFKWRSCFPTPCEPTTCLMSSAHFCWAFDCFADVWFSRNLLSFVSLSSSVFTYSFSSRSLFACVRLHFFRWNVSPFCRFILFSLLNPSVFSIYIASSSPLPLFTAHLSLPLSWLRWTCFMLLFTQDYAYLYAEAGNTDPSGGSVQLLLLLLLPCLLVGLFLLFYRQVWLHGDKYRVKLHMAERTVCAAGECILMHCCEVIWKHCVFCSTLCVEGWSIQRLCMHLPIVTPFNGYHSVVAWLFKLLDNTFLFQTVCLKDCKQPAQFPYWS